MADNNDDLNERTQQITDLFWLADEFNQIRASLAIPDTIHRRPSKRDETPWELVTAQERAIIIPENGRFLRPALRALANFRAISQRASEARFAAKNSPLLVDSATRYDSTMRLGIIVTLEMTMEALFQYWNQPLIYLCNESLELNLRRDRTIKSIRLAMLDVARDCGPRLLEAGAITTCIAQDLLSKLHPAVFDLPENVRPEIVDALRFAMKNNKTKKAVLAAVKGRNADKLIAFKYLESTGEFKNG